MSSVPRLSAVNHVRLYRVEFAARRMLEMNDIWLDPLLKVLGVKG